jgi:Cupin superfamily protein
MVPNGRELAELLSPHSVQQFLTEYWGRKPLYISGPTKKFSQFGFDLRVLERVIRARAPSGRLQVRFVGPDNALKQSPKPLGRYSVRDGDLTVCADWISDCFEVLASYCAGIKAGLNLPGSVFMTCYASPDGHGFGTHFDCHPSFILQIEGSKHWRFSASPAVEWPPANLVNARVVPEMMERYPWLKVRYPDDEAEAGFLEQELTPGDVLFLPAGTWHRARAIGYSVALTMTCIPMTAADFAADLVRGHLSRSVEWRRDVPPVPVDAAPPTQLPPAVERFFEARLSELRQHVQSLSAGDLYETWTHYVHSFDTPFTMRAAEHALEVDETDTLALVRELPLHYVVSPRNDAVSIYYFDHRLDLSYDALPLVKAMVAHASFPARQAMQWLGETFAWPDVKALLQELVRAGILRITWSSRKPEGRGVAVRNRQRRQS